MATYQFRARERAGAFREGTYDADTEAEVIRHLEAEDLLPIRVVRAQDVAANKPARARKGWFRRRAKSRDLITFTRQLETLLDSGVPLTQSLAILVDQTSCPKLKESTGNVLRSVEQGSAFGEALEAESDTYPPLFVGLIRAGEEGGVLAEMLSRTAALLEHEAETQERIKSATFYPLLVITELGLAFGVLVKFVLPRYASFFKNLNADLPLPTRLMMGFSDTMEKYGAVVLLGFVATVVGMVMFSKTPKGRWFFDLVKIRMPIFGVIVLKSVLSRFARLLAALIASGTPITVGLNIIQRTVQNKIVEDEVTRLREGIVNGGGVGGTLLESKVFPPLVVKMLAVGEETGSLDKMLIKVSDYYDRDVDYLVKNLTTAIEPILLTIMGVSVLFIALAVFMPMWNLMSAYKH